MGIHQSEPVNGLRTKDYRFEQKLELDWMFHFLFSSVNKWHFMV
jgi:hypothetical protein